MTTEEDLDTRQEAPAEIIEKDAAAGSKEMCVCTVSATWLMISVCSVRYSHQNIVYIKIHWTDVTVSIVFSRHIIF